MHSGIKKMRCTRIVSVGPAIRPPASAFCHSNQMMNQEKPGTAKDTPTTLKYSLNVMFFNFIELVRIKISDHTFGRRFAA